MNKELDELDSFGGAKEAGAYAQASFLFDENTGQATIGFSPRAGSRHKADGGVGTDRAWSFTKAKTETTVPHGYVVEALMRGPGFSGGKGRVCRIFQTVASASERAKLISKEYGLGGGCHWPIEGHGLCGYDYSPSKGITVEWKDGEGRKQGHLSWGRVEKEIEALVRAGIYDRPVKSRGSGDGQTEAVSRDETGPPSPARGDVAPSTPRHNYRHDPSIVKRGGPKTRYGRNIEAISLLKRMEGENRLATPEEQTVLADYVGWGGLAQAFDPGNAAWAKEYREVKGLLSDDEYASARASVNNAFYTTPEVAAAMHGALVRFGFRRGNILEPALGIGNFFGVLPDELSDCKLYGVEVDSISGRIAKQLYPNADITIKGFEKTDYPDNFFDVAIGNVPFGDYRLHDPKYNKHGFRIHDYFIAKALELVRPGGMVAVITSKGTLDKKNPSVRRYIAQRAELAGAVRLPNHAFKDSAGTEVTSDIIFLQKRERMVSDEPDWVHLGVTDDGIPVNAYFAGHPEMMLGRMGRAGGMYGADGSETACVNDDPDFDMAAALDGAIANIKATISGYGRSAEDGDDSTDTLPADPDVRNFTYTLVDGGLYYRENSLMVRKTPPAMTEERIRGLHGIRNITRELIDIQLAGCTESELREKQALLNREYDRFVWDYGHVTAKANKAAFRHDSDYPLLASLEVVDEDGTVRKAGMFHKQTIRPKNMVLRAETAIEALNVSVNEHGYVNIPFMLGIYEPGDGAMKELMARKVAGESSGASGDDLDSLEAALTDMRVDMLVNELGGIIYRNPLRAVDGDPCRGWETADEYLSGNVREKLRLAASEAENDPAYAANVEALAKVQPEDVGAADIEVRIGTSWIDTEDYEQFIYELLETPSRARRSGTNDGGIRVKHDRHGMKWRVEGKRGDDCSVMATKTFGTSRMDAYTIFEETLNLRAATVRDRVDNPDGTHRYVVNRHETVLAQEKQGRMKGAFKEWLFAEAERRAKYVEYYNETFNATRLREYDGSQLEFPGMSPEIRLEAHQVNAVARIIRGGNTLLAHAVGAGKSFEMIAACMEKKRLGLANKTCLVVPKPLIVQMASEFMRLYPSANILVTTERDFEKNWRRQFVARIATGDYDAIIMSHSQFEKIPISVERREKLLAEQIEEIADTIDMMKKDDGARWTVKQMEAQRKRLENQLEELSDASHKDDLINFEELGIDSLMVDEAHAYKNLAIFSKMNNVAGISSAGAKKSTDMLLKCQYINELTDNRGVVFATGTPISNTMCEMYVMQLYLQKPALERMGIYHFDAWAANFGEVTTTMELSVEGSGFRFKSRFNKFVNIPELLTAFREVADIQTADMLSLDVPGLRGGGYVIADSEPDGFVKRVMADFVERAESIRLGNIDPSVDNFLKITHEARLLGTDARLLFPDAPDNPDGKLNRVAGHVRDEYQAAMEKGIVGCQLVFSDIGTPGAGKGFTVYDYIKESLIDCGIPADEIAFIHDAKTDAQRDALFRDMRSGRKKILIGSTDKCGTGVNVQKHLVAMHHVDCPWKASGIIQREGRGLRQGNENKEVAVYRYVTKGTFDAYMWMLVENKHRFTSQIMRGRLVSRTCEEIDEAIMSYAEIKAIATGNPLIKEMMEIDGEVHRLKLLKAEHDSQRYRLQDDFMIRFPRLIRAAEEKLACVEADMRAYAEDKEAKPDFAITIGKVTHIERADGGMNMIDAVKRAKMGETTAIGSFRCFELLVEKHHMDMQFLVLRGKTEYKAEMSQSAVGNMVKLENLLEGIGDKADFLVGKIEGYRRDLASAEAEYEKPFVHEAEYRGKLARLEELDAILRIEEQVVEAVDLDVVDGERENDVERCVAEDMSVYGGGMAMTSQSAMRI